jgi:hypothetical protein
MERERTDPTGSRDRDEMQLIERERLFFFDGREDNEIDGEKEVGRERQKARERG